MKTVEKILQEMQENRKKIRECENIISNMSYSEMQKSTEISNSILEMRIENAILYDNVRQALFAAVIPVIIDIFGKYTGKPYGEKTKEKINAAAKEKINCAVYIYNNDELHIVPLNGDGFTDYTFSYNDFVIYTKYVDGKKKTILDNNNKIQPLTIDILQLYNCAAYTENIPAKIKTIRKSFEAVKREEEALKNAINNFNSVIPSKINGLNNVYFRNYI